MTAPRGISQPPTSFIGSQCQGIHHAPLYTYNTKNQRKIRNYTTTNHTTHAKPQRAQRKQQPPTESHVRPDARNHYPQIKHHTPPPRWSDTRLNHQPLSPAVVHPHRFPSRDEAGAGLLPHSPIVCSMVPPPGRPRKTDHRRGFRVRHCTRPPPTTGASHPPIAQYTEPPHGCGRDQVTWCSLERR